MTRRRWIDRIITTILGVCALIVVIPVIGLIGYLVFRGGRLIDWEFISAMPRKGMLEGGILPCIIGTTILMIGTMAFALPVGVFGAVYLTEYARPSFLTRIIRLSIVNLAGVPSVVYGLFGLGVFVLLCQFQSSILSGSLTLALLVLPLVITATEEALRAVPISFREASMALGATRWQTIWKVILRNAQPGILTGSILSLSRAAGETAPILFTVAAFYLPELPKSIFNQVMTLSYHVYIISTQVPNATDRVQWGSAFVLFALVLGANSVAIGLRIYLRRMRQW